MFWQRIMMSKELNFDIVIIGLGPAGATFARLIDPSLRVAAIDKKKKMGEDSDFLKPCGGLLATDAQKALAHFDLVLPKEILVDPQIFSVRTIDLDSGIQCNYQRFYMNMDRHRFDMWLESMIGEHIKIFSGSTCKKIERQAQGFRITFLKNGTENFITSRYIVGADGANSCVRRTFFPDKKIRTYLSIQQWYEEKNAQPFYSCIFDSKNTDCYSWSISKDGYFVFGGAYPKSQARARFENQKQQLEKMGFSFGPVLKKEACLVLRPSSIFQFITAKKDIFFIGEAAGFISPSSLEGISSAMTSAALLSTVFNTKDKNPAASYQRKTIPIRLKLSIKLLKCPFLYHPFIRKIVMKSGLGKIQVLKKIGGRYV